jgi:hypothetical protein
MRQLGGAQPDDSDVAWPGTALKDAYEEPEAVHLGHTVSRDVFISNHELCLAHRLVRLCQRQTAGQNSPHNLASWKPPVGAEMGHDDA